MKKTEHRLKCMMIAAVVGLMSVVASQAVEGRWGKGSSISAASPTLDGVKPLANWIWDSGAENPQNYYLLVRKSFNLEKLPKDANAYISAYAYADVYINGRLLERCPMNCDPEYQCYDKFNILSYLHEGENCVAAVVQNFGVGLHSQMNARGGFFFQAKLDHADGSSVNLLSDNTWKVTHAKSWNTKSKLRSPGDHLIGFVEEFDARLWPEGWQNTGFNDAAWENAKTIGIPPVAPWNSLVVIERPHLDRKVVKPVRTWNAGNLTVYDFGVEIVGYPQLSMDAKEGVQFEIGTGERLNKNNVPVIRSSGDHTYKYTTQKGPQIWRPYTWMAFRYLSIQTNPDVRIQDVSVESAYYNYEMGGSFECSDPQLNEFWNIGKHTIRICSIDTYMDSPWRERTQYIAGDTRYLQIYGNYAFGKSSRFLTAYNLLCGAQSQRWRKDGAVRSRYPTDYLMHVGSSVYCADYQLEWVLMMHEYFMFHGRDGMIESLYPNLKKAMEYFQPFVDPKTGLLAKLPGWIVLDWPDTYKMERKEMITGLNCLYYGALNAAAAIATDITNDPEQARIWRQQAQQLRDNINTKLWSEKDRAYLDTYGGTQTHQQPQVYALIYGLPDESRKADLMNRIMKQGKASEQSFAYWVLNSMFSAGKDQWALDYMRENWGAQTKLASFNGAWHEGWNLPWGTTSHAWCSGPTALLSQKVLGLEPTAYGWKTFAVHPHIGDLKWARGTVSTVAGDITAAWEKTDSNHFTLKLTVPPETQAKVYLPATDLKTVKKNGKPFNEKPDLKPLLETGKGIVLEIGPGDHQLECETGGE